MLEVLREFIEKLEDLEKSIQDYEKDVSTKNLDSIDEKIQGIADHQLDLVEAFMYWRNASPYPN